MKDLKVFLGNMLGCAIAVVITYFGIYLYELVFNLPPREFGTGAIFGAMYMAIATPLCNSIEEKLRKTQLNSPF